jgi:hypothetical protein
MATGLFMAAASSARDSMEMISECAGESLYVCVSASQHNGVRYYLFSFYYSISNSAPCVAGAEKAIAIIF